MEKRKLEIPLSRDQLADLGEIVAIHGAIAFLLESSVTSILPADALAAAPLPLNPVRHEELAKDAKRWLDLHRPHLLPHETQLGEQFITALEANVLARSDLVHSAYVVEMVQSGRSVGYRTGLGEPAIAKRLQRGGLSKQKVDSSRPAEDIKRVRDEAKAAYWLLNDFIATVGQRRYEEIKANRQTNS